MLRPLSGTEAVRFAMITHEANRVFCEYNGDTSQPTWAEAPQWQKDSAIAGVRFHNNNPNAGDSASHDAWSQHKVAEGWVYGEVKDPEAKTHPCLVPFEDLPADQQFKDRLFRTIVHAALAGRAFTVSLLKNLRAYNIIRDAEWDTSDNGLDGSFFGNELAGEVGEAIEVVNILDNGDHRDGDGRTRRRTRGCHHLRRSPRAQVQPLRRLQHSTTTAR
jgi:hypothetical protein